MKSVKHKLANILYPLISRYHVLRVELSKRDYAEMDLSYHSRMILQDLTNNGFSRYRNERNVEIAESITSNYFDDGDKIFNLINPYVISYLTTTSRAIGNHVCRVSFGDSCFREIFFSKDVFDAIQAYSGTSIFYRENPLIEYSCFCNPAEATRDIRPYAVSFHSDYYRQLNVMLLLTDIVENGTCTEYAVGSHKRNVLSQGVNLSYPEANNIIENGKYPIHKITGKKGDIIVMDTTGIHRARVVEGSVRKMLVCVANPNYPFLGYSEPIEDIIGGVDKGYFNTEGIKQKTHR